MARGKKTPLEDVYKVMVGYAYNRNINDLARQLDMPEATVRLIVEANKDKEEFKKLQVTKENEFIVTADKIISKATKLLDKRLTTALERQGEIDLLLDTVYDVSDDEMKTKEKLEIAKKLSRLQLNGLSEITTAIGTMYDKRALAKGDPTSNVKVSKLEDIL